MKTIKRKVILKGITPIMFDRYGGNNDEQLPPMKKAYYSSEGNLVFPALNVTSFLSSQNTESAPQRVVGKKWKTVAKAALSFVQISPFEIPILREGKPVTENDLVIMKHVARVKKGNLSVPNPKERPVLGLPWSIEFDITLWETNELSESVLQRLFEVGGLAIGIGTFRGVFGKFVVDKWE